MTRGRRGLRWALSTAALLAVIAVLGACGHHDRAEPSAPPPSLTTSAAISRPDVGFRTSQRLDEHYAKHGNEFGSVNRDEYLHLAQALRDRPVGGAVLEIVRNDDTVTRFERDTGAFLAFARDGTIRTFFRPNDGEQYFRRQARR